MRRRSIILLLVAAATAQVLAARGPATAQVDPVVTSARIRIELTTSSDWARLRIEGASFPATRVLESEALAPVTSSGDGWTVVNRTGGTTRFVIDTVTAELSGRSQLTVVLEQGWLGSSTLALLDPARGANPFLVEQTGRAADGETSARRALSRTELLGSVPLQLPHADPRRLVLAAYYPWFGRSGNPTATMAEEPLQPRSAWDPDDVVSQAAQARQAGIDGFAVSWGGDEENGPQLDLVVRAMEQQGGVVVPYLETPRARNLLGGVDTRRVAIWLDEALSRSSSPAFLRAADGIPVVMVFSMGLLSADTWRAIADDSAERGRPVHLVGDADPSTHAAVLTGWHRYDATAAPAQLTARWQGMAQRLRGPRLLDPSAPITISMATVSPGYDDTRLRGGQNPVVGRGAAGERYEETWDAAVRADPDWILITSWNEWFEGTSVEPGTVSGGLALAQTAARIAEWKGTLSAAPTPTTSTSVAAGPTAPAPSSPTLIGLLPWHP